MSTCHLLCLPPPASSIASRRRRQTVTARAARSPKFRHGFLTKRQELMQLWNAKPGNGSRYQLKCFMHWILLYKKQYVKNSPYFTIQRRKIATQYCRIDKSAVVVKAFGHVERKRT